MNVRLPDGTVIENVPEGVTQSQLIAMLGKLDAKARQDADYRRNLGEERQKMMDERGFFENAAASVGKVAADAWRGVSQWTPFGPSREEVDRLKQADAPLMESGGGIAGNLAGEVALSLAPLGAGKAAQMVPAVGRLLAASPKAEAIAQALSPNTVIGGTALGLGMGAAKPVGTEDSRIANAVLSGMAGGAVPAAIGVGRAAKAAFVDPLTQAGKDRIAGRMLQDFASNPELAQARLQLAKSNIPGVLPTAGEATLDPGIATLERTMYNFPGPMPQVLRDRAAANNAARQQFLEALTGTPDQLTAAKKAASAAYEAGIDNVGKLAGDVNTPKTVQLIDRLLASPKAESEIMRKELEAVRAQMFEPYPAAERLANAGKIIREAVDAAHKRGINAQDVAALEEARRAVLGASRMAARVDAREHGKLADAALERLYGLETKTKGAQQAVQEVVDLLGAQNLAYKRDPARLAEIYKTVNSRIQRLDATRGTDVEAIKALNAVKRSLRNQMDAAVGPGKGFSQVNANYRTAKQEINQMEALQGIASRDGVSGLPVTTIDAAGNPLMGARQLQPAGFLKATDPGKTVKVGGKDRKLGELLNDQRAADMALLRGDVSRANAAANAGKAQGSPTAQFLYAQNLLRQSLGPLGLPTSWADRLIGGLASAPFVGAPLAAANRYAGRALAEHVGEVMMDPRRAAQLMAAAQAQQTAMLNPGVSRLLPPTLVGALGSGMFGQ